MGRESLIAESGRAPAGPALTEPAQPVAAKTPAGSYWSRILTPAVTYAGLLAALTFAFCCLRFNDPDMWWHLRMGQEIWQTHSIPQTDHWSFTVFGNSFLPHEWLAQVSLYLAYHFGGYSAVELWTCVLAAAIVVVSYAASYAYSGDARCAMLGGFTAFFFGTIGFSGRPLMIGYLLLALELLVLHRGWTKNAKTLWTIPAIFAIWVNCHGSYALGLGILALAVTCQLFANRFGPSDKPLGTRLLVSVFAASASALLLNPIGLRLLTYPVNVFTNQRASLASLEEWLPLTIQNPRGAGLWLILAAVAALALLGRVRATRFELLLVSGVSFLALQHTRMVFVFGIVAAPILSKWLAQLSMPSVRKPASLSLRALLLASALLICILVFPKPSRIADNIRSHNPEGAVNFIRRSALQGPMLNDYGWGGYLVWALPERKVFIDGRGDVYDWAGVLAYFFNWANVQSDPSKLPDEFKINFCLLPVSAPMTQVMRKLSGWEEVYRDDVAVVIARK